MKLMIMKLLAASAALVLASCVTTQKVEEAMSKSPMSQGLGQWEATRDGKHIVLIPRGFDEDKLLGEYIFAGATKVKFYIPPLRDAGSHAREALLSQAIEGAVAIQAADFVTAESVSEAAEDLWMASNYALGLILREVAMSSGSAITQGDPSRYALSRILNNETTN